MGKQQHFGSYSSLSGYGNRCGSWYVYYYLYIKHWLLYYPGGDRERT